MSSFRARVAALLTAATVLATLQFIAPVGQPSAEAAEGRDFDPGNIISDEQFFDGAAMSAAQVQSFIDAQLGTCSTGATCLDTYAQATPAMPVNAYCDAMPGRSSELASSIVARVGAACGVSQRVLLVLLQKEQSLVTSTAPSATRYARATGFGCPDTAPCDSSFGGFFYQVYYAARQFQRYATHPGNYQHRAGVTNQVLYHPNAACGSSPVFIRNQATAGLYNYTPYQPNGAALANLYGTGDTCSAYGNRNFWRMWTDWFGSPTSPVDAMIARAAGSSTVYLISGSTKHEIPTPELVSEYDKASPVTTVPQSWLDGLATGRVLDRFLRTPDGRVRLIDDGKTYLFRSCSQLAQWAVTCAAAVLVTTDVVDRYADGGAMQDVIRSAGAWWRMEAGKKREIGDTAVLAAIGYGDANTALSSNALNSWAHGAPLLAEGFGVRNEAGTGALMRTRSALVSLNAGQAALAVYRALPTVSDASYRAATPTLQLPNRILYGSSAFVVTDRGLLPVDPRHYGGASYFAAVASPALSGFGVLPPQLGSHFVGEVGTSAHYLIREGYRELMDAPGERERAIELWDVPTTIHRGMAGVLNNVPERNRLPIGTLVRESTGGPVHMIAGSATMLAPDAAIVDSLGYSPEVRAVDRSIINGLAPNAGTLSSWLVTCGGTSMLASQDSLLGLHDAARTTAALGLSRAALAPDVCADVDRSAARVSSVVLDERGALWVLEQGTRRFVDSQRTVRDLGLGGLPQTAVDQAVLAQLRQLPMQKPYYWSGLVVGTARSATHYMADDGRLLQLGSPQIASELGFSAQRELIGTSALAAMGTPTAMPSSLVSCGGISYVAIDGRLVRLPAAVAREFAGGFTGLSATLCGKVPVSGWLTQWITGPDGTLWFVEGGERHRVWRSAADGQTGVRSVDQTVLDALPEGAPLR